MMLSFWASSNCCCASSIRPASANTMANASRIRGESERLVASRRCATARSGRPDLAATTPALYRSVGLHGIEVRRLFEILFPLTENCLLGPREALDSYTSDHPWAPTRAISPAASARPPSVPVRGTPAPNCVPPRRWAVPRRPVEAH